MADDDLKVEPFGPPVQINIEISAEIYTQEIGERVRAYAVITARCGDSEPVQRMMLPGPYDGPKDGEQLKEFKARWRGQLRFDTHSPAFQQWLKRQLGYVDIGDGDE